MIKRLVIIAIFIFISCTVYLNFYFQEKNENYAELIDIGQTENAVSVVFSTEIKSDDEIYSILSNVLSEYKGNLYCFDMETIRDSNIYTKYILINNLEPFYSLPLKEGRFYLLNEREGDYFIATEDTNDKNQIGRINTFDKNTKFQIKTLKKCLANKNNVFQKMFILELPDTEDYDSFQKALYDSGIIVSFDSIYSSTINITPYITLVAFSAIFILGLIILYDLIKSYKQIGVEKLVGYDNFAIWGRRIPKLIFWETLIFLIAAIILTFFLFAAINTLVLHFLVRVLRYYCIIIMLTLVMCSLPFIYVNYIPINSIIKNRRPAKAIICFNFFIKTLILTVLFITSSVMYYQLETIVSQKRDKGKNWEKVLDYVYIYELAYKDERFDSSSPDNNEKWKNIYLDFNKKGGIKADFSSYSPIFAKEKMNSRFPEYCDIIVNPNYLHLFPIEDINGNTVAVSERENDYVVLVPEKYKNREKEIYDYYEYIKNGYSGESEKKMKNEKTQIIWIKNHQRLFSCAVDVGIEQNNTIEDALVVVLTEENGATEDYCNVVGSRNCPFKIKVMDTGNPSQELNNIFSKYFDLKEIAFPYTTIRQNVEAQLQIAQDKIRIYAALIIILLIMGIAIVIQSIIIYMEQYRKVLAIKKIWGYRFRDRYYRYFLFYILGYILAGFIAIIIKREITIVHFVIMYWLMEFIFSILYIHVKDRANIISVVKGG